MNLYSRWIAAARHMKAKGDTYSHKHCLRVAREEYNHEKFTTAGKGYTLTLHKPEHSSVIVQLNPSLPGTWQARLRMRGRGFDVVVLGSPWGIRGGKSIYAAMALAALGSFGVSGEIIAIDEADSVPDVAWERLLGVGIVSEHLSMAGIYGPHGGELVRDRSLCMSKGDKIRQRKMFGGW